MFLKGPRSEQAGNPAKKDTSYQGQWTTGLSQFQLNIVCPIHTLGRQVFLNSRQSPVQHRKQAHRPVCEFTLPCLPFPKLLSVHHGSFQ